MHKATGGGGFVRKGNAFTVLQAELMAIREGLLIAITYGWEHVQITSDCLNAVAIINEQESGTNENINMVNDCRELLGQISWCRIQYEGRKRNTVANGLARFARKELQARNSTVILDTPPACIHDLYFLDLENSANWSVTNASTVGNNYTFHENVP